MLVDPEYGQMVKGLDQLHSLLSIARYFDTTELTPYLYRIDDKALKPEYSEALLQAPEDSAE